MQQLLQPAYLRPVVFAILEQGARDIKVPRVHAQPAIFCLGDDSDRMLAQGFALPSAAQSSREPFYVVVSHSTISRACHRIGGTINAAARHAPRAASAEQARGLSSRSRQICTSRSRGASCRLQVTMMDCPLSFGLARRNSAAMALGDCSISWVTPDSEPGMAMPV